MRDTIGPYPEDEKNQRENNRAKHEQVDAPQSFPEGSRSSRTHFESTETEMLKRGIVPVAMHTPPVKKRHQDDQIAPQSPLLDNRGVRSWMVRRGARNTIRIRVREWEGEVGGGMCMTRTAR